MVISSSGIAAYKKCKKLYWFQYDQGLQARKQSDSAALGTQFHHYMERAAQWDHWTGMKDYPSDNEPMWDVADEYLKHFPIPKPVLVADKPQYIRLGEDWLRWTPDLVYRSDTGVVIRDYKTFDKWPSVDTELDFQARIYLACAARLWPEGTLKFEHEYVRRTPPGVPHNKKEECWTPEECYLRVPLYCSFAELDRVWKEALWVVQDIKATMENGHWYRQEAQCCRAPWGSDMKDLCKAEIQLGCLDDATIDLYATRREPLKLPEGLV